MRRQPVGMVVVDPLGDPDAARYAAFCLTGERRMERAIAYLVEVEAAPQRIENCGIDVAASGSLPCQKNIGALHFEDGGRSRITFRDVPEREPPPARIPWEISAVRRAGTASRQRVRPPEPHRHVPRSGAGQERVAARTWRA